MSALQSAGLWSAVLVIGGLGAVARFVVDGAVARRTPDWLPFGTLAVNISGSFLLGVLDGVVLPPHAALLAGTGFVGAYTTFSTWMLETHRRAEGGELARALTNLWLSLAAGIGAALLGLWVGGGW